MAQLKHWVDCPVKWKNSVDVIEMRPKVQCFLMCTSNGLQIMQASILGIVLAYYLQLQPK